MSDIDKTILELYEKKYKIIDICKKVKKGNRYVSKILKDNNISLRYSRFRNLTEQTINFWKVINRDYSKNNGTYWYCLCLKCNKKYSVLSENLTANLTNQCFKCSRLGIRKGYGELSGAKWSDIINSAKRRQIEFNITKEFAYNLFLKQQGKCALTGVKIDLGYKKRTDISASLDRIDSSKGYLENNIWWVHKIVNQIKWDLELDELKEWCRKILSYNSSIPS